VAELMGWLFAIVFALGALDLLEFALKVSARGANSAAHAKCGNQGSNMKISDEIEKAIQDGGLTAPRVTPDDIEANIVSEHFFTAAEGLAGREVAPLVGEAVPQSLSLLTFCVLVLRNGFTVTGESACASPENFNAELGRKIARKNAIEKIWPLMGYELRSKLAKAS
jgi:hypothetical protein